MRFEWCGWKVEVTLYIFTEEVTGEPVSTRVEHDMWSLWGEIVIGITTSSFSCEIVTSCSEKLTRTRGKVGGRSGADVGLSAPFCVGFEFTSDVEGEGVGALEGLEDFLRQNFKTVEQLMYNNTSIITRMMPVPVLPMPVVKSLTACPVDWITLEAASPKLPTTFSSRSLVPFRVS